MNFVEQNERISIKRRKKERQLHFAHATILSRDFDAPICACALSHTAK